MKSITFAIGVSAWVALAADQTVGQAASPGPLFPLAHYRVEGGPWAIAASDWNRDGFPDLATANHDSSQTVAFLAGRGDGTFAAASTLSAGAQAQDLVVGDWNADGNPDLATAAQDGAWVVLGLGAAGFAPATGYAVGGAARAVATADYDGDGSPDLALTVGATGEVGALLGLGNGAFEPPLFSAAGPTPRDAASGDFDADGKPDLLVTNDPSALFSFLRGRGNGTFHAPVSHLVAIYPYAVAVADVDLDGDLDAAIGHYNTSTDVALGTGDGGFAFGAPLAVAGDCSGIALRDVDADGDPDLLLPGQGWLHENLGGSGFGPAAALPVRGQDVAIADFDGDADADLAFPDGGVQVGVVLGLGGLAFEDYAHYPAPGDGPGYPEAWDVTAVDLDADGRIDLATTPGFPVFQTALYFNQGGGTYGAPTSLDMGGSRGQIEAADLDGDGHLDLVASDDQLYTAELDVRLGLGGGVFGPLAQYFGAVAGKTGRLDLGDLDGDGAIDAVTTGRTNTTFTSHASVFLGGGDGTFAAGSSQTFAGAPASGGLPLALADADNDGALDALVGVSGSGPSGGFYFLRGKHDGSFEPALFHANPDPFDWIGMSMGVGDLDLDGDADVALGEVGSGALVFGGTGTGAFDPPTYASPQWVGRPVAAIGDMTGDGWPDLVADGMAAVVPGQGGLAFGEPLYFRSALESQYSYWAMDVADLDGNGALDVAAVDVFVILARPDPPVVSSIDGLYAGAAGSVELGGAWLGAGTSVQVDGAPVAVQSSSPTSLVVQVGTSVPGWQDVDVANGLGATAIPDGLERWPTLSAGPAIVGQTLALAIDNGTAGIYVLGLSAASGPPIALPGIWHQIELGPTALLKVGTFGASTGTAQVSFLVPGDPALSGATAYAQAWALQGDLLGAHTQSFTSLVAITVQ